MVGRADKGLFITTGTFSPATVKEATQLYASVQTLPQDEADILGHSMAVAVKHYRALSSEQHRRLESVQDLPRGAWSGAREAK